MAGALIRKDEASSAGRRGRTRRRWTTPRRVGSARAARVLSKSRAILIPIPPSSSLRPPHVESGMQRSIGVLRDRARDTSWRPLIMRVHIVDETVDLAVNAGKLLRAWE